MSRRWIVRTAKMDTSLKEFLASFIQSLPVSTDKLLRDYLHYVLQDLSPCVVPVGLTATFISVLSVVFVAYKWNRTNIGKQQEKHKDDDTDNNHAEDQSVDVQRCLADNCTKDNNRPTVSKDSEIDQANQVETDSKLRQKNEELMKTIQDLTEELNNQQSLQHESKSEKEFLIKENQELKKKLSELQEYVQQSDAEVLQELKNEQKTRKDAEKSLQELKTELGSRDQKLKSLSSKVENLHQMLKKTEDSQQVLIKKLENQNQQQNNQKPGEHGTSLAFEELKAKLDSKMSENKDLQKKLQLLQLHSEALSDKKQQVEAQLAELKERYKQEFRIRIMEERQWRAEIDNEVEILRMELENKKNALCSIQTGAESMTLEDEQAELEEGIPDGEDS